MKWGMIILVGVVAYSVGGYLSAVRIGDAISETEPDTGPGSPSPSPSPKDYSGLKTESQKFIEQLNASTSAGQF